MPKYFTLLFSNCIAIVIALIKQCSVFAFPFNQMMLLKTALLPGLTSMSFPHLRSRVANRSHRNDLVLILIVIYAFNSEIFNLPNAVILNTVLHVVVPTTIKLFLLHFITVILLLL